LDKLDVPRFSTLPGGKHTASVSRLPASGGDCGASSMRGRLWLSTSVKLLLVRSSYKIEWNFPGGTVRHGETPEVVARRELAEEISLAGAFPLVAVGDAWGLWDGRGDRVHFFELRLDRLPELQLDNREIIAARLISPSELRGMALTRPVAVYLGTTIPPGCHSE
jgi:8-oxo-dGTP diphosphatase